MTSRTVSHNFHSSRMTLNPLTTLLSLRTGNTDSLHLFELFAILAQEAGRDDLHDEFHSRAASPHAQTPPITQPLSPEADRLQKDGCRLIRESKLAEAETTFRKAIKLDPSCADAHGNLGVAFAQQRRLPEAEY
jgi:hypothetical protein